MAKILLIGSVALNFFLSSALIIIISNQKYEPAAKVEVFKENRNRISSTAAKVESSTGVKVESSTGVKVENINNHLSAKNVTPSDKAVTYYQENTEKKTDNKTRKINSEPRNYLEELNMKLRNKGENAAEKLGLKHGEPIKKQAKELSEFEKIMFGRKNQVDEGTEAEQKQFAKEVEERNLKSQDERYKKTPLPWNNTRSTEKGNGHE